MLMHSNIYRFNKVVKMLALANKRLTAKTDCFFGSVDFFLIKGTRYPSSVKSYNNVIVKNLLA